MDSKTLALVSYIFTPIGWLITLFSYKGQEKNSLVSYHLRQSFGLFLTYLACYIVYWVITLLLVRIAWGLVMTFSWIFMLVSLALFVLMIIGIITASKGEEKPLPIIGKMFEGKFSFIP